MSKLNEIQMKILKRLLFQPNCKFTGLLLRNMTSDHLSYHLKQLISLGYVSKDKMGLYSLTPHGKEFANTFDTEDIDKIIVEKQPKVAVLIVAQVVLSDVTNLVIQKRLKEPYFGFQGFITGKVKFGESFYDAAARELMEETNLTGDLEFIGIIHEFVYTLDKKSHKNEIVKDKSTTTNETLMEDKIFNIFLAKSSLFQFGNDTEMW
ncbi:NUDIX domain-containing protein [Candidatus Dojkabacteria bacterium]|nr:NUDIX domain-containing protein [Candidatus Dojkabacteria bacterium]